jgi:alpha-galactosidase
VKERIVLIGAGSAVFTRGLTADLLHSGMEAELRLVDTNPDALEVAERLCRKMAAAARQDVRVSASVERREVLRGATAVICTVGVGGRRAWEKDVLIPRRYGIYQPVGDTVGPGGTSRAMRMIPAMVGIAEDVLDLAPDALLFNYSNPMSPICRAVRKATGAEIVGLCHGVVGVARYLAGVLGVEPNDLSYTALGINHLTWFVEACTSAGDAMPRLQELASEEIGKGVEGHPFSWHLLRVFGAFPAVLDRHVCEFFPQMLREGAYYGKTLGTGPDAYSFEHTIAHGDRVYAQMREDALSPHPLGEDYARRPGGEGEQVLEILASIRQNRPRVYSVNLPNTGQVPNLPPDAVIECPAVVDGGRLRALAQRPLPTGVAGTLASRFEWVETVVEAALEASRAKFVRALWLDGAVDSLDTAERLADDLLDAHGEHLPPLENGNATGR